ncbi:MAG: hypothetical protein WBB01_10050 [Phormidesmis sp.]
MNKVFHTVKEGQPQADIFAERDKMLAVTTSRPIQFPDGCCIPSSPGSKFIKVFRSYTLSSKSIEADKQHGKVLVISTGDL